MIGLTGSFGSGCSYIAENILKAAGYKYASLSDVLKDRFQAKTKKKPDKVLRSELQDFGDDERKKNGSDFYAKKITRHIKSEDPKAEAKWVVDSIRNPKEVSCFRDFSQGFFLFGVYADREKRRERVKAKYSDSPNAFDDDDSRDSGKDTPAHGQKVENCFSEADVVFSNDERIVATGNDVFKKLAGRVQQYAELVQRPLAKQQPTERETLMGMAYAISQRSSCRKRKVGAIIVDVMGNIISSGYNEVPREQRPCTQAHNNCFRDLKRSEFITSAVRKFPGLVGKEREFEEFFKSQFRILDMCRALHAEENAILNLARSAPSVSLSECTLYTTTYPCRLCANKIATVGIGKIVYVEPYPDPESKAILRSVTDECFEGVTFKAYFRVYGEEK